MANCFIRKLDINLPYCYYTTKLLLVAKIKFLNFRPTWPSAKYDPIGAKLASGDLTFSTDTPIDLKLVTWLVSNVSDWDNCGKIKQLWKPSFLEK